LGYIIHIYNNSEHSSLNNVKPSEASKPGNREDILNINLDKEHNNKNISDLHAGDKVRKIKIRGSHAIVKGTDPRWSNEVFTVSQVQGKTITLEDNSRYTRNDVLKVPADTESSGPNVIDKEKKIYKDFRNR
jgi:hypothetical protein